MAMKKVYVDIEMGGSKVMDFTVDPVNALPEHRDGRLVHLVPEGRLYVSDGKTWSALSRVGDLSEFLTAEQVYLKDEVYTKKETYSRREVYNKGETYSRVEVDDKLEKMRQFNLKLVDSLEQVTDPEESVVYLVPSTNSKNRNIKDEYIWSADTDGTYGWEQIGSTTFKLEIDQGKNGIMINGTSLQSASPSQPGLMTTVHALALGNAATKTEVSELRTESKTYADTKVSELRTQTNLALAGKQDTLIAGEGIIIDNNIITATGTGTSATGGNPTRSIPFQYTGGGSVVLSHYLDTYDLILSVRTAVPPIRYVNVEMEAVDRNSVRLLFSEGAPTGEMVLNIVACVYTGGTTVKTVDSKTFTDMATWSYLNESGRPMFVQTYDADGNQINGDVIQVSTDAYNPVTVNFSDAESGTMLVGVADKVIEFKDATDVTIDLAQEGLDADAWYAVHTYIDNIGLITPEVIQNGDGIIKVGTASAYSGYILLKRATMWKEFSGQSMEVEHNLDRVVGTQVYFLDESGDHELADLSVMCSNNRVTFETASDISGTLLIV